MLEHEKSLLDASLSSERLLAALCKAGVQPKKGSTPWSYHVSSEFAVALSLKYNHVLLWDPLKLRI